MEKRLLIQAILKFLLGLFFVGLLLFLPAGTFAWRNGWIFILILFVPMFIAGLLMLLRSPELLRKRLNAKESEAEQKSVIALSGLILFSAFILAGLNHRFSWIVTPEWTLWCAVAVFLFAYLMYAEVLRENACLSRTVEVQENQKVIDTGLYGLVRHPMYVATLFLFLSMPWVLGSPISFAVMLFYIPIIGKRMQNEEAVLICRAVTIENLILANNHMPLFHLKFQGIF